MPTRTDWDRNPAAAQAMMRERTALQANLLSEPYSVGADIHRQGSLEREMMRARQAQQAQAAGHASAMELQKGGLENALEVQRLRNEGLSGTPAQQPIPLDEPLMVEQSPGQAAGASPDSYASAYMQERQAIKQGLRKGKTIESLNRDVMRLLASPAGQELKQQIIAPTSPATIFLKEQLKKSPAGKWLVGKPKPVHRDVLGKAFSGPGPLGTGPIRTALELRKARKETRELQEALEKGLLTQ